MRRMAVTADQLPGRRARYFMEQQIGPHGTIVSIALYALGLPVLRRRKSTFIYGIEDDARELIDHLGRYLAQSGRF